MAEEIPPLPAQLPPRAHHPDQALPSQSTLAVAPDGTLQLSVVAELPCTCPA